MLYIFLTVLVVQNFYVPNLDQKLSKIKLLCIFFYRLLYTKMNKKKIRWNTLKKIIRTYTNSLIIVIHHNDLSLYF